MTVNKVSNSSNAIQAYKDKLAVDQKSKTEVQKTDKQTDADKSTTENNSVKVSLSSKKIEQKLLDKNVSVEKTEEEKMQAAKRQARIEEIAEQIKNNTFKVNPEAVANKMLQNKNMVKYLLED